MYILQTKCNNYKITSKKLYDSLIFISCEKTNICYITTYICYICHYLHMLYYYVCHCTLWKKFWYYLLAPFAYLWKENHLERYVPVPLEQSLLLPNAYLQNWYKPATAQLKNVYYYKQLRLIWCPLVTFESKLE